MAQTLFLPALTLPSYSPSSPDPTPLRMLAFSVAEAALKPDPNSPSFGIATIMSPQLQPQRYEAVSWTGTLGRGRSVEDINPAFKLDKRSTRRPLWDMAERAKERKERGRSSPAYSDTSLPPSPPISPNYKFSLPENSSLAASVETITKSASPAAPSRLPLYTRSAEPSPTSPTFATLDQSRPPPVFVPRLSAQDFSARHSATTKHQRTKSDISSPKVNTPSLQLLRSQVKVKAQPPSLKQIQAKMSNTSSHRRGPSITTVPEPKVRTVKRSDSEDSVEVLKTPTDEKPRMEARIKLSDILSRRPPTPPSPSVKESRLAPFLRERINGRLAGNGAKPSSISPLPLKSRPTLKVTLPSFRSISPPTATVTPTRASFPFKTVLASPTESRYNLAVSTPPACSPDHLNSPTSPTGSASSFRSSCTLSPTLSVPIITCTPAPIKVVKNGVEHDSDEDEGDVVVFDGEEDAKDREEREKRGKEMKARLRRRCSE